MHAELAKTVELRVEVRLGVCVLCALCVCVTKCMCVCIVYVCTCAYLTAGRAAKSLGHPVNANSNETESLPTHGKR